MFSSRTLIKRYTPPTCTLEIYSNRSFFAANTNPKIPEKFQFNLHFDDPRLPDEKRITIKGNRSRLDLLSAVINNYVNNLIKAEVKENNQHKFDHNQIQELNKDIYLLNKGLLNQELYYFSRDKNNIETNVKLTTLQLFDLANALEQYTLDINNPEENSINAHQKSTLISLTAMFVISIIFGGIWWHDRQIIARSNQEDTNIEEETDSVLDQLKPPQPLNPESIPTVPQLQVPSELQNRQTLAPPSPTISQPPKPPNNANNNNQKPKNIVIPPPPKRPLPPPNNSESIPTANNVIAIKPKPVITDSNQNQESTSNNNPSFPSLPVLQSNSNVVSPSNLDSQLNNNVTTLPQNINQISSRFNPPPSPSLTKTIDSAQQTNTSKEVKQYFQKKWQPPENLSQSIEYRLLVDNNGSVQRIIPVGQTASTFLDRTGMPLMGEIIASSFSEKQPSMVRLILRPNGDVETFLE